MATWVISPTGLPGNAGTAESPRSWAWAWGNAGNPPQAGDVIELLSGTYAPGNQTINVAGSANLPITFRMRAGQTAPAIIDGALGATNGNVTPRQTGWTLVNGNGRLEYGNGNSGTTRQYVYRKAFSQNIRAVFCDDYVWGRDWNSPGTANWWWVALGDYGHPDPARGNPRGANPDFRLHEPHAHSDGSNDNDSESGSVKVKHGWQGQFKYASGQLDCRFHTAGVMSGSSPAHSVYVVDGEKVALTKLSGSAPSNITIDGGPNKLIRFHRWYRGIYISTGPTNFVLQNCEFRWTAFEAIVVDTTASSGVKILGNRMYGGTPFNHYAGIIGVQNAANCEIGGNEFGCGGHHAIETNGCSGLWIHDNYFHHIAGYAINQRKGTSPNGLVEHNWMHYVGETRQVMAHMIAHGAFDMQVVDWVWRHNEFYRCGHAMKRQTSGLQGSQFYNNTIIECEAEAFYLHSFTGATTRSLNNQFKNNVIHHTSSKPVMLFHEVDLRTDLSGNQIRNNQIYSPNTGGNDFWFLYDDGNPNDSSKDHSNFFSTDQIDGEASGAPGWVTSQCSNNGDTDPLLVSVTTPDFGLQSGSPCINAGTTTDLTASPVAAGAARSWRPPATSTRDIGSREWNGSVAVTGYTGPTTIGGSGGGSGGGTNVAPTLNLTANGVAGSVSGPAPFTVAFDDNASDPETAVGSLTHAWNFGDKNATSGNTVTAAGTAGETQSFTYSHPGVYTAQVTVTDAGGAQTIATRTITVTPRGTGTLLNVSAISGVAYTAGGTGGTAYDPNSGPAKMFDGSTTGATTDSFVRRGVLTAPQYGQVTWPTDRTITRIRVKPRNAAAATPREHVIVLSTLNAASALSAVHSTATWKTLTGAGNEWTEIDFAARSAVRGVRIQENSNSDGSDLMSIDELEIYEATAAPSVKPVIATIRDSAGRSASAGAAATYDFGPAMLLQGKNHLSGDPLARWVGGPLPGETWLEVEFAAASTVKRIQVPYFGADRGLQYTVDYLLGADTSSLAAVTLTGSVASTNRTNGTEAVTESVLATAATGIRLVRIVFKGATLPCCSVWAPTFVDV